MLTLSHLSEYLFLLIWNNTTGIEGELFSLDVGGKLSSSIPEGEKLEEEKEEDETATPSMKRGMNN